ncbi:MAG: DUF1559 domain-containing protein [Planctomycetota bacterium]
MKTLAGFTLLVVLFSVTHAVGAEPGFDPGARAKAIAPFIDAQTVAVVYVDLTRIEVDPLLGKLVELVPEARWDVEEARPNLTRARDGLLKAGARELYVVVSLADVPRGGPFVILPGAGAIDVDALRASFPPPGKNEVIERIGGAWFVGLRQAYERVKSIEPDVRDELARAFEAADDTAAQLLLMPPAHSDRVIEEMMPTLPEEIGGGPSTILTRGLLWAVVGMDAPPKMSFRLVIQSQDQEAAEALRGKWLDVVRFLSTSEEAQRARRALRDLDKAMALRNFEEVVELTTPKVENDRLVINLGDPDGSIQAFLAALTPPLEKARARAKRAQSMNNLKQLGLAMHNYYDVYKTFPAVGNTDAGGKLLLSWRVHILPYVEQQKLYEQFHLDEPWDSEHNRTLIEKMPAAYRSPASKHREKQGLATYRVVSGEETVFPGREGIPMKEIKDGTSNTIMIVEVDDEHAVIWTKPEGLPFDPEDPERGLGGQFEGGFNAAICDGSARFFELPQPKERLRALFTRAGGEVISW